MYGQNILRHKHLRPTISHLLPIIIDKLICNRASAGCHGLKLAPIMAFKMAILELLTAPEIDKHEMGIFQGQSVDYLLMLNCIQNSKQNQNRFQLAINVMSRLKFDIILLDVAVF